MADPLDQPVPEGMALVVPFVVCRSVGGPYDDDSFVAGFQAGEIDKALQVAAAAGASTATWTVRTALVSQLELLAINRGFGYMATAEVGESEDHEAMPEWSLVTFSTAPIGDDRD